MPTITLRVSKEEHDRLTAMAQLSRESLSDLLRRYHREGLQRDAEGMTLEAMLAEYKNRVEEGRNRLFELYQTLQRVLETTEPPSPPS